MITFIYTIPIGGKNEENLLSTTKARIGNIFNSARQSVIYIQNDDNGNQELRTATSVDTFSAIDNSSNITLRTNAISGNRVGYAQKTSTYTITAADYIIDCTSGTFTVYLPTASGISGREYIIKNSGAGVITLDGDGSEQIDGATTQTLSAGDAMKVLSTDGGWIIL